MDFLHPPSAPVRGWTVDNVESDRQAICPTCKVMVAGGTDGLFAHLTKEHGAPALPKRRKR